MTDYVPPEPIRTVHQLGARFLETITSDHRTNCSLCQHWPFGEETLIRDFMGEECRLTDPATYSEQALAMSKDQLLGAIHQRALWALWYLVIKDPRPSEGTTAPGVGFDGWCLHPQARRAVAIAEHVLVPHWHVDCRSHALDTFNVAQLRAILWILQDEFENLC